MHFGSIDDQAVLLVGMDGAEPAEWTRLTQKALDSGALTVGSVLPPVEVSGLATDPKRTLDVQLGLIADLDGEVRSWKPAADTLGARLLYRGGQLVPDQQRSIPLSREGIPVLDHSHVDYVGPAVFEGRTIVFAELESWEVPMVAIPAGHIPAAEAMARAIAGPNDRIPTGGFVLLIGAVLGLLGALSIHTRRLRTAWLGLGGAVALVACCALLGIAMPIEVPAVALGTGALVAFSLAVSEHRESFKALVDRALWHLRTAGERPSITASWEEVSVAAVDLNVATRAWVLEQDGERWKTLAAANADGLVQLVHNAPPEPFRHPLTMPLRSADGREATLLLEPLPFVDPDSMVALKELIEHTAQTKGDTRLDDDRSYFVTGVSIVHASLDAMLRQGAFMQGAAQASVSARALFDPLGRLVSCDPRIEPLLFPYGRALEGRLVEVWTDLGGARNDVARVLTGRGARTLSTPTGDVVVMRAARHGVRLVGVVIEAVSPGMSTQPTPMYSPGALDSTG